MNRAVTQHRSGQGGERRVCGLLGVHCTASPTLRAEVDVKNERAQSSWRVRFRVVLVRSWLSNQLNELIKLLKVRVKKKCM